MKASSLRRESRRRDSALYLLVAPAIVTLGVWYYYPVIHSFVMSLFDWDGFLTARYVGMQNFVELFTDPEFWTSLKNMALVLTFSLTIPFVVPFIAAELIAELHSKRWRELYRTFMVLPVVVPSVIWILMWRNIYDPTTGALNRFIRVFGQPGFSLDWLNEPATALGALLFIGFPFVSSTALLFFSAALEDIPRDIYDAARVDGVPHWLRIRHIDIPFCVPQFRFLEITSFAGIIANYTSVLLLTQGRPLNHTLLPGYYLYRASAGDQRFGYASAVSLVLVVFILLLTLLVQRHVRSETEFEAAR
ncbi:MAG TPA: sugar ABC transporter permease [Spirochaetia bacterium]|nr:sugar ABC transporter permease [Spirochaetia bacterium]